MKIVAFSDTHFKHKYLKFTKEQLKADMLICAGDYSGPNLPKKYIKDFIDWFHGKPHKYKILIDGNHDFYAEKNTDDFRYMLPKNITYLQNEFVELGGLKIYGSPNTTTLGWAYGMTENELEVVFEKIPQDVDILITHSPAYGTLDLSSSGWRHGSHALAKKMEQLKPKIHIFGHVHNDSGMIVKENTICANVSVFNGEDPKEFEI